VGDLLRDWRRINVAVTRAELKLVLVGSARTLSAAALSRQMLDALGAQGAVYALSADAVAAHARISARGAAARTPASMDRELPRPLRHHAVVANLFAHVQ
jgi:hypothetical protein